MVSATPVAAATVHHVTMTGFPANPSYCVEGDCSNHTVVIARGDTVVWTYADGTCDLSTVCPGHTATSTGGPGSFSSPTMFGPRPLRAGGPTTFSTTFGNAGTYTYTCAFHGSGATNGVLHMDGAVQVQAPLTQSTMSNGPTVSTNPGWSNTADTSGFPVGTSNSVAEDQLPNTFVPGLPTSGRPVEAPAWALSVAAMVLLGVPSLALTSLGLAARRR